MIAQRNSDGSGARDAWKQADSDKAICTCRALLCDDARRECAGGVPHNAAVLIEAVEKGILDFHRDSPVIVWLEAMRRPHFAQINYFRRKGDLAKRIQRAALDVQRSSQPNRRKAGLGTSGKSREWPGAFKDEPLAPVNGIVVLGIARDVDEKQPVKGSKIGGLPYGCDAEVPEYDEFLASISASHLEKPVFPGHADIGLFVHEGEVGYSMML